MSKTRKYSEEFRIKYEKIGHFVANFNDLDARLDLLIGILANKDDVAVGEIISAAINSFIVKCNISAALVNHLGGEDLSKEYKKLDKACRRVNDTRIDLIHGEHWLDFDEWRFRMRRQMTTSAGFKTKHIEYSAVEIGNWAEKVKDLEADLYTFCKKTMS